MEKLEARAKAEDDKVEKAKIEALVKKQSAVVDALTKKIGEFDKQA